MFCKKETVFLEILQNLQESTCRSQAWNFIKKETLGQVFSCEFCEISKDTFFTEHHRATASKCRFPLKIAEKNLKTFLKKSVAKVSVWI